MAVATMATERVLPAIALPSPGLPHTGGETPTRPHALPRPAGAGVRAARPAVARREAILNTPTRAGILIGASAAIYAVSLAAVSGLQYQSQAELAAQHRPILDQIASTRAANNALQLSIQAASARLQAVGAEYGTVGKDMTAYQAQLDSLAVLVAKVQGSAAALSGHLTLPSVSIHGAIGGGGGGGTVATTSASAKP